MIKLFNKNFKTHNLFMVKFSSLLKKDFKLHFKLRSSFLIMILSFVLFIFFSFLFKDSMTEERIVDKISIGLVDTENSKTSKLLLNNFEEDENFNSLFELIQTDLTTAENMYSKNEISSIIIIPEGFTKSLFFYENKPFKVILNPKEPLKSLILKNLTESLAKYIESVDAATYGVYKTLKEYGVKGDNLSRINDLYSMEMIFTALNRGDFFSHNKIDTFPSSNSIEYFLSSIVVILILFFCTSAATSISDEINSGCIFRFITTPSSNFIFLLSKLMSFTFITVIHSLTLISTILFFMNLLSLKTFLLSFMTILSISLIGVSLSIFAGTFAKSKDVITLFVSMSLLLVGIIGGNFIPIQLMPGYMQELSKFTPNYWMIKYMLYSITGNFENVLLTLFLSSILFSVLLTILSEAKVRRAKI